MTTLIIPDLHAPFQHEDTLPFLTKVCEEHKPDRVVCIGDEIDAHALSKWEHDPDGYGAGQELGKAKVFLKKLYKLFPEVCVCVSNHTARPFRKAYSAGIPKALIKTYRQFLDAPKGWQWADSWTFDDVQYQHGEGYTSNNWTKAPQFTGINTVLGHTHAGAGVFYYNNFWTLNVGCLLDMSAYAFNYAKHFKMKPNMGCGVVKDGVPHFIPLGGQ